MIGLRGSTAMSSCLSLLMFLKMIGRIGLILVHSWTYLDRQFILILLVCLVLFGPDLINILFAELYVVLNVEWNISFLLFFVFQFRFYLQSVCLALHLRVMLLSSLLYKCFVSRLFLLSLVSSWWQITFAARSLIVRFNEGNSVAIALINLILKCFIILMLVRLPVIVPLSKRRLI